MENQMDDMNIDIETTSQRTHISIINLNYLFNYEFDKLNEFKTNSFISIIQREMGYDLEELKDASVSYYKNKVNDPGILIKEYKENRPKNNKNKLLIILAIVFIILVVLYTLFASTNNTSSYKIQNIEQKKEDIIVDNKNIDLKEKTSDELVKNDQKNIEELTQAQVKENSNNLVIDEKTDTDLEKKVLDKSEVELKNEQVKEIKEEIQKEDIKPIVNSIKLKSNKKVWVGITYLDTLKSDDFTTKNYTFDPKKDFVAVFGHNHIKILFNDEIIDFKDNMDKRRISYINGKVNIITKKKLNKIIKTYKANK
jgi:hypothetical protein